MHNFIVIVGAILLGIAIYIFITGGVQTSVTGVSTRNVTDVSAINP